MKWEEIKQRIQARKKSPYFREREIWVTYWGDNVGHEQNGTPPQFLRPVLILQKFSNDLVLAVPLSSQDKEGNTTMILSIEVKT